MAAALLRGINCGGAAAGSKSCVAAGTLKTEARAVARVVVPPGAKPCPSSGSGAACGTRQPVPEAGTSAVPSGLAPCPVDPNKSSVTAPGSCAPEPDPSTTPSPAPSTQPVDAAAAGAPAQPSVAKGKRTPTPQVSASEQVLTLTADKTTLAYGSTTVLDASTDTSVTGTPWAIEVFDATTKTLVGACTQSNECQVAFTGKTGLHTFVGYVVEPTPSLPSTGVHLTSNTVAVRWLGIGLAVDGPSIVAPGKGVTFTAYASEDVGRLGYRIELHDPNSGQRLTYCSHGTTCSMSLVEPSGGVYGVLATLEATSPNPNAGDVTHVASGAVFGTWLDVHLTATSTSAAQGGTVWLTATANADLGQTPWSLYIFNQGGQEIGSPCNTTSCDASITLPAGDRSQFRAVVARVLSTTPEGGPLSGVLHKLPTTPSRLDIQATSPFVQPTRVLWGVDSCKVFTDDPSGSSGLLPQVISTLGTPDFWGRYLPNTGNCPGLTSTEIAAARAHHMGILPIFNDYDCSAVSGGTAGITYAQAAVQIAQNDGIPAGTGIAIDIEPVGDWCPGAAYVDVPFIAGWYDTITKAGYKAVFYGNSTYGSAFGQAWCATYMQRNDITTNSYLWSFEPSLQGSYSKGTAPAFGPNFAGCASKYAAWQYELSAGSTPDVDHDEATSQLPLWYP
jgi:glycoside hydrolase-like protein